MLDASIGGGAAARCGVYRHAIAQFMKPALAALQRGPGWSDWSLALAALLMVLQPAPTLRQRFAATLVTLNLCYRGGSVPAGGWGTLALPPLDTLHDRRPARLPGTRAPPLRVVLVDFR